MNPGTIVDSKYQIVRLLGQGGMGAVYEARHQGTSRRVALKVIIREALASGDREIVTRFEREARASGAIDSQHVVQVLDTGVDPATSCPYLVMEYLAGEDLHHLVERLGPLDPELALRIIAQACSGLARAHDAGIVHRDIKSANIFVARREDGDLVVKLLDFGIAKVRVDPMQMAGGSMTRTGAMLGSPLYMSPEQVVGKKEVDGRSDLYSLGVTLYEALAGRTPYHDIDTIGALVLAICSGKGDPIRTHAPRAPSNVVALLERSMATEPGARFTTAEEMRAAVLSLVPGNSAALHERMLVRASSALDRTAALPTDVRPSSPGPVATPEDVRAAANRLLPRSPAAATAPLGVVTPIPTTGAPPVINAVTGNAFAGTNPSPNRRAPTIAIAAAVLGLLAVTGVAGIAYSQVRGHASRTAVAPPSPSSEAAAPATRKPEPRPDPGPAESAPAPAPSAMASAPLPSATSVLPSPKPPSVAPPRASLAAAPSPSPSLAPPPAAKAGCNPNYYFDAKGVKHFKEECL